MATLPDLDTDQISFVAYWNAIDQGGVDGIDPSEVTSDGNIVDYTIYDNGIEGNYSLITGREGKFRVKEDGWFVTWLDRTESFATSVSDADNIRGPWDVVNNWNHGDVDSSPFSSIINNTLERAINSLQAELSNSGSISYLDSDVGLYDYRNEDAATLTQMVNYANNVTNTPTISYTSSVTQYWSVFEGHIYNPHSREEESGVAAPDGGSTVELAGFNMPPGPTAKYGSVDSLENNLMPDSGTSYSGINQSDANSCSLTFLSLWG